jgi:Zn-dependent protease
MFLHRIKVLTLAGFTVWIDASWLILAALLTWTLAVGEFPRIAPNLSTAIYWWMGLAGAVGLFISIVLHELTHALIARRYAMPIAGITLFIFGGVAELHKEPTSAKAEFLMAIGGPITSMVLGTILLVVAGAGQEALSPAAFGVVDYLGDLNWILALFNLIPAFPLDGGRVLRAGLWGWMNDFGRATRIAAGAGEFFGIAMILYGILEFATGNTIAGVWLFFIGLFLHGAAGAARQELAIRRTFAGLPVSVLMQRNPIGVAPDLSIADLIEHYFYRYHFKAFPVLRDDELVGCVMAICRRAIGHGFEWRTSCTPARRKSSFLPIWRHWMPSSKCRATGTVGCLSWNTDACAVSWHYPICCNTSRSSKSSMETSKILRCARPGNRIHPGVVRGRSPAVSSRPLVSQTSRTHKIGWPRRRSDPAGDAKDLGA